MKLLIIRPQPGADATAKRVYAAGFDPIIMPLFAIKPLPLTPIAAKDYDAVLLTSGNAVRAAGHALSQLAQLPLYAVGAATARALDDAMLPPFCVGTHGVDALVSVARQHGHRRLLWLAGEDYTDPQDPADVTIDVQLVYRSVVVTEPEGFDDAVRQSVAVLLHSPRAARHFAGLCELYGLLRGTITVATFSQNIAENAGDGWAANIIATVPNDAALLSELQRRFTTVTRDP